MSPERLNAIKLLLRAGAGAEWSRADIAYQAVEQMARRDWAVRVLDAWVKTGERMTRWVGLADSTKVGLFKLQIRYLTTSKNFRGPTPDAARLAAAEAIWPELPESVRAELGERP